MSGREYYFGGHCQAENIFINFAGYCQAENIFIVCWTSSGRKYYFGGHCPAENIFIKFAGHCPAENIFIVCWTSSGRKVFFWWTLSGREYFYKFLIFATHNIHDIIIGKLVAYNIRGHMNDINYIRGRLTFNYIRVYTLKGRCYPGVGAA